MVLSHQLSTINHQLFFHNVQGIERIAEVHESFCHTHQPTCIASLHLHVPILPRSVEVQRNYESNQTQADVDKKKQLADFLEQGEKLKSSVKVPTQQWLPWKRYTNYRRLKRMNLLNQGYFNDLTAHDSMFGAIYFTCELMKITFDFLLFFKKKTEEQESSLLLLWSAKSALFQMGVKLQSELQPLRNSKDSG
ncbi:hypothetical protein VP01_5797g2 [Puccinia sorghi]|uniref:Uncharacterized protein n=1 Tax=Puccinia sorghi TaxID=27349 RepID=A0A0L6UIZ2_9BASI|nr:hypothetical protein VP01_5797g2 [Puccinia sorghi]